jgi:hypothetical protein
MAHQKDSSTKTLHAQPVLVYTEQVLCWMDHERKGERIALKIRDY